MRVRLLVWCLLLHLTACTTYLTGPGIGPDWWPPDPDAGVRTDIGVRDGSCLSGTIGAFNCAEALCGPNTTVWICNQGQLQCVAFDGPCRNIMPTPDGMTIPVDATIPPRDTSTDIILVPLDVVTQIDSAAPADNVIPIDASTSVDSTTPSPDATSDAAPPDAVVYVPIVTPLPVMPPFPGEFDPTCDGRPLTGLPSDCRNLYVGQFCIHACFDSPTPTTSSNPLASQRPTSLVVQQFQEPNIMRTILAPMGNNFWQASVFFTLVTDTPLYRAWANYNGPTSSINLLRLPGPGQGLRLESRLTLYAVNTITGVQTPFATEVVANEPTLVGTGSAFASGGSLHPIGFNCPSRLARTGSYTCNNRTDDEPAFSGVPILN